MVDLVVDLAVSTCMLSALVELIMEESMVVELVVGLEFKVVLTEDVGVEPTVGGAGYESRIDWSAADSAAHAVVEVH